MTPKTVPLYCRLRYRPARNRFYRKNAAADCSSWTFSVLTPKRSFWTIVSKSIFNIGKSADERRGQLGQLAARAPGPEPAHAHAGACLRAGQGAAASVAPRPHAAHAKEAVLPAGRQGAVVRRQPVQALCGSGMSSLLMYNLIYLLIHLLIYLPPI